MIDLRRLPDLEFHTARIRFDHCSPRTARRWFDRLPASL
jgi:hypothetical protein